MKVKIIESFIDKDTGKNMEAGKTVEYKEERAAVLIKRGFAEEVKPEKEEKPKKEEK